MVSFLGAFAELRKLLAACMWVPGRVGVCMRMRMHVCRLPNPARNAYAPYCDVICGTSVSTIFCDIISQTMKFSEKVIEHKMCVFIFSTTFV